MHQKKKKNLKLCWIGGLALAALALLTPPGRLALARQVSPVRLSALEIALWPEYDEPKVLVIFQGRLADGVPLPASLTLTMPLEAGEPHAVAAVDEEGSRWTAAYDVEVVGDAVEITYTALQYRAFQFEYYWDALQIEGERRQFTFRYALDLPVDDLSLELQQPAGATGVVLDPPATESYPGFSDLVYHRLPFGAVDAGRVVEWEVRYDKSSPGLSIELLSADSPAAGASDWMGGAILVVGVALALGIGGFWIARSRQQAERRFPASRPPQRKPSGAKRGKDKKGTPPRPPRRSPDSRTAGSPGPPAKMPGGFCHQCGAPLQEDALFCHRCGTRRKGA